MRKFNKFGQSASLRICNLWNLIADHPLLIKMHTYSTILGEKDIFSRDLMLSVTMFELQLVCLVGEKSLQYVLAIHSISFQFIAFYFRGAVPISIYLVRRWFCRRAVPILSSSSLIMRHRWAQIDGSWSSWLQNWFWYSGTKSNLKGEPSVMAYSWLTLLSMIIQYLLFIYRTYILVSKL